MSHFLEHDPRILMLEPKRLKTSWPAVRVRWEAGEQGGLIVMPTQVPVQKEGILTFVPLPDNIPVLIPIMKKAGHYQNVRPNGAGTFMGKPMEFWVSYNTSDPEHCLIAWDGESGIQGARLVTLN